MKGTWNVRKWERNERKWKEMESTKQQSLSMVRGGGSKKPIFGSFWLSFCYRSGYRSRQGVWLGNLFEDIWSIFNANSGSFDLRLFACWAGLVWLAGWITKTNWKGTPCGPSPLTKIVVFNTCHVSAKLTWRLMPQNAEDKQVLTKYVSPGPSFGDMSKVALHWSIQIASTACQQWWHQHKPPYSFLGGLIVLHGLLHDSSKNNPSLLKWLTTILTVAHILLQPS